MFFGFLDCTTAFIELARTGWFLAIKYKNRFPNFRQLMPWTTCIPFDLPIREECAYYHSSDMHIIQTQIMKSSIWKFGSGIAGTILVGFWKLFCCSAFSLFEIFCIWLKNSLLRSTYWGPLNVHCFLCIGLRTIHKKKMYSAQNSASTSTRTHVNISRRRML